MTENFNNVVDNSDSVLEFIFGFILDKLALYWRLFLSFFMDLFGSIGKDVVNTGDIVAGSFQKNGLSSFNNFFYMFIGVVFISFALKAVIKLVLKAIEIIGNYIPFT